MSLTKVPNDLLVTPGGSSSPNLVTSASSGTFAVSTPTQTLNSITNLECEITTTDSRPIHVSLISDNTISGLTNVSFIGIGGTSGAAPGNFFFRIAIERSVDNFGSFDTIYNGFMGGSTFTGVTNFAPSTISTIDFTATPGTYKYRIRIAAHDVVVTSLRCFRCKLLVGQF